MRCVLVQKEKRKQFDARFKRRFGVTFTKWIKTARKHASEEMLQYEDGKIFADITVYSGGFRVYTGRKAEQAEPK